MKKTSTTLTLYFLFAFIGFSQGNSEYTGGLRVNFNEDGSKYMRTKLWGQFWAQYDGNAADDAEDLNFSIRRARILTYAQLNKKFVILTHLGFNNFNSNNQSPTGLGEASQLFFHDFWGEWKIADNHNMGMGLHYWNGISRLNNQSTLNMLTLDNNRQSWATIGLSDQFARHIGIFAKGNFGKLHYRLAVNQVGTSTLDTNDPALAPAYRGKELLGAAKAGKVYQGYFDYNFLGQESNFQPYKVGTYLGSKKIFNIGAGFFSHPNGVVIPDTTTTDGYIGDNVFIFAIDAFYDTPLGEDGSALTAYAVYQSNDYGENYALGTTYTTGGMFYTHVGYLVPGPKDNARFQPYLSYQNRSIDATNDTYARFGLGANLFQTGHHSKFSLEYSNVKVGDADGSGLLTFQAMIYL